MDSPSGFHVDTQNINNSRLENIHQYVKVTIQEWTNFLNFFLNSNLYHDLTVKEFPILENFGFRSFI